MAPLPQRRLSRSAQLHLVAAQPRPASRPSLLALWHLLSLDAPTVAAFWTAFIGWSAGVRLSRLDPVAMFVAVWVLYATDRLLDARAPAAGALLPDLEERHRFHHRFRQRFVPLLVLSTLLLALLLHRLAAPVLHLYVLLATLLAGWLLLVHVGPSGAFGRKLPKELAVGLFFPAAVFIPTVARAPALRPSLLAPALLFAGVCTLNCLFLYAWEHTGEHAGDHSRAHLTTRWALGRLLPLAGLWTLMAALLFCLALAHGAARPARVSSLRHPAAIPLACTLSLLCLLLLHARRSRFSSLHVRALADAALLTPVVPLFYAAVRAWG